MRQYLSAKKIILLTILYFSSLLLLSPSKVSAVISTGNFSYSTGYYSMKPNWLDTNPNDGTPATPTCPDTSGCVNLNLCFNSWAVGQTDCGTACSDGNAWTKYSNWGCFLTSYDPENKIGTCETTYIRDDNTYSIGDKYNSNNTPVMNAGNCNLNVGGPYKTCCLGTTPVSARNLCSTGSPLCDPYDPPEADCGGYTTVFCGFGGYPACGQAACNTLYTPTPTPTPTPPPSCEENRCTSWTNSDCGNGSNGCSVGQRKQTRSCNSGSTCSTSQCITDSSCNQSCTPFSQGSVCDTGTCPNGSVCAQGHKYCKWDGSGYGPCSEEINNCSSQCAAPTSPPSSGCTMSACGGGGCSSNQRYVSGDKCYSDYSWYIGPACYTDNNGCNPGGGTSPSSVSCTATSPVAAGTQTTISITQNPAHTGGWDGSNCFHNPLTANISKGGSGAGSCSAGGFNEDNRTRSCNYTPASAGTYTASVYLSGHDDPRRWECYPTCINPDGSWCGSQCSQVGCEQAASSATCTFSAISMTPCPGGTNACGSSTYQGLSGCNGYFTYPNNADYNRWCSANAGASRSNCYSCNPWGSPPTIISSSCSQNASGTLNTASLFWNRITGADPYISSQSPVYGYYNIIYGTSCNPSNPSTCQTANNIYAANKTLNNLEFGEYTWAVQGCNAVTNTCGSWSSPSTFNCNVSAWIQTTGGDVHSNVRINAPGGP